MTPRPGRFITFEGLDGSGKSTQLALLAKALRQREIAVVTTREPGGTPIGERIRSILLDSRTAGLTPFAEMGLMFSDRAQHIQQVILPGIKRGSFVLCDRYTDSSEAYQGHGRGLGPETVLAMHKLLCRDLWPELTILLQSGLESSIDRARHRNQQSSREHSDENRFEKEGLEFYRRVAEGFSQIAKRDPQRVKVVAATGSIDATHKKIMRIVEERFPEVASSRPQAAGAKK